MKNTYENIKKLIIKDQVEEALDILITLENSDEIVILFSRWQSIKKNLMLNTINNDLAEVEINKIKKSLLYITKEIFLKENEYKNENLIDIRNNVLFDKANDYYFQNAFVEAIIEYKKILDLDPANEDVLYRLIRSLYMIKAFDNAIKLCIDYLDEVEKKGRFYNLLGVINYEIGRFDEAIKYYEEALLSEESNELFFKNIFHLLGSLNKLQEQLDLCNRFINKFPSKSFYLYMRSKTLYNTNNFINALSDIQIAISFNPLNPEYYYHRAWLYSKQNMISLCYSDIETAYRLAPNIKYLKLKSAIAHDNKDYKTAILIYSKILYFEPNNDEFYYCRADSYFNNGELEKAKNDILKAISLFKEKSEYFHLKSQIESKLKIGSY